MGIWDILLIFVWLNIKYRMLMKITRFLNVLFLFGLFCAYVGIVFLCLMCCWQLALLAGGVLLSAASYSAYCLLPHDKKA